MSSRIMQSMVVVGVLVGLLAWSGVADAKKPNPPGKQAGKFVVLGTGEVLDTTTSLRWQQTPGVPGDTVSPCDNGVVCNWFEAWDYCEALGDGSRLAGVKELQSLVDYSVVPAANALNTPNGPFTGVQAVSYWSASTVAAFPQSAWLVRFSDGIVRSFNKRDAPGGDLAWCVRGAQAYDGQNIVPPSP